MAKLEIFENGTFADGVPAHQIGTSNADGGHDAVVFEPMTLSDAKSKLKAYVNNYKSYRSEWHCQSTSHHP